MTTRNADRVAVDTNVLLAASDAGRAEHRRALAVLDEWPRGGTALYTSGQILREYLVVATRPLDRNGLGLSRSDAAANVRALAGRMRFMAESEKVSERLLALVDDAECGGKQIHDANVVATMVEHGLNTLVTRNVGDFARYGKHITVLAP